MLRRYSTAAALALPLPAELHFVVLRRWFRPHRRLIIAPVGPARRVRLRRWRTL